MNVEGFSDFGVHAGRSEVKSSRVRALGFSKGFRVAGLGPGIMEAEVMGRFDFTPHVVTHNSRKHRFSVL